jgi:hypothetical protein
MFDFIRLWAARRDSAARVAKFATQQVYGGQQATLAEQIAQQSALIAKTDRQIAALTASVDSLRLRVGRGAIEGNEKLRGARLQAAVSAILRSIAHQAK